MNFLATLNPEALIVKGWKEKKIKRATLYGIDWEINAIGEYMGEVNDRDLRRVLEIDAINVSTFAKPIEKAA